MMMNRLLTSVLCSLVTVCTVAQTDPTRPRLVVGIVVDQLRTDYIEYLQSLFGEKGFRRLMTDGAYLRNVDFQTVQPDAVSATAMLYTGSNPAQTGVPSANAYDRARGRMQHTLARDHTYTPEGLLLSTVSDELAIDGIGLGAIYSLAADPQQAVIMAGHAGTAAYWISEENGKWVTSPYYRDAVATVTAALSRRSPDARIDTMQWKPSLPLDRYPGLPAQKRYYPFRYTFSRADRDIYRKYIASPLANREVTQAAIECLRSQKLGNRAETIDMLNIALTAAPYKYAKDADSRLELQDTYLRLDADLAALLDAIDQCVGLENALVYLSSTGYYDDASADAEKYRIPTGNFSVKRAVSLLNAYLSATYGNDDYVAGYAAGHFYLNEKAVATRRLDGDELAERARDFLNRMAGIADAYTVDDILSGGDATLSLRNSLDIKNGGDIYVMFTPGWTVTDDTTYPEKVNNVRSAAVASPFFMLGHGIEPRVIGEPVDAVVLAPTITQVLRIRAPNGASSRPLMLNSPR